MSGASSKLPTRRVRRKVTNGGSDGLISTRQFSLRVTSAELS